MSLSRKDFLKWVGVIACVSMVAACGLAEGAPKRPKTTAPTTTPPSSSLLEEIVYVVDYATPQLAADACGGKRLVFPVGQIYTVASLTIPAGCYVEGNGSTLKFGNRTTKRWLSDEIVKVNGSDVTIDGLNLDGNSQNQRGAWSEYRHNVRIQGAFSNVAVQNCNMINIIGDGVYVNTQTGSNIRIGPNNTFSANYDNRNGVSVISGDTVEVFSNTFTNISRTDMPASIDIEPNLATDHLQHIDVHDNTIIGGSAPAETVRGIQYAGHRLAAGVDVRIHNNNISGTRLIAGVRAHGYLGGPFNPVTGLVFDTNNIHDIGGPGKIGVELDYWIRADVTNNTLNGMQYGIYNDRACLGASTGNVFVGVTTNITNSNPQCA